jgi:hypothetical protein
MGPQLPKEEDGGAANGYDPRILRRSTQSQIPHRNITKTDPLHFRDVSVHYRGNPLNRQ